MARSSNPHRFPARRSLGIVTLIAAGLVAVRAESLVAGPPTSSRFSLSFVGIYNLGNNGNLALDSGYDDHGNPVSAAVNGLTFTGLDSANATRTTTFTALNQASAAFGGLHLYSSGTVTNNYYNDSNPPAQVDQTFHPEGSPDGYYSLGFAGFDDVLQFGGSLQSGYRARYLFHVHGTNSGNGGFASLSVGIAGNPDESFFAVENGTISTTWGTQSYEINGITPQTIHVQFSNQFVADCFLYNDGANISGISDFGATITLTAVQVVDANDHPVSGVTVSSDSGTVYPVAGDVNGDGVANGSDIQSFVNIVGATTPIPGFYAADLNQDAVIDSADAELMVNLLLGA